MRKSFAVAAATLASALVAFVAICTTQARADSPFSTWAVVVIAGDAHAHSGGPSEAFDNARRDVAAGLVGLGFVPSHMRTFSTQPQRYEGEGVLPAQPSAIYSVLKQMAGEATGGCLVYLTSHGNREGVLVGGEGLTPRDFARMLDDTCGDRMTVAIISACYSGIFVRTLASPNRMVLTAARPDRSSFGCGESDKYPYFDACFLAELPNAHDFPNLGRAVQRCVAERERQTHASPPSEPQLEVGSTIAPMLTAYAFPRAAPSNSCGNSMSGQSC